MPPCVPVQVFASVMTRKSRVLCLSLLLLLCGRVLAGPFLLCQHMALPPAASVVVQDAPHHAHAVGHHGAAHHELVTDDKDAHCDHAAEAVATTASAASAAVIVMPDCDLDCALHCLSAVAPLGPASTAVLTPLDRVPPRTAFTVLPAPSPAPDVALRPPAFA